MSNFSKPKPPVLFWVLAVIFVVWNLFGCVAYIMDKTMSDAAYAKQYGEAMLAVRDSYPVWATAGYAFAVWGGLLAAILFVLRKRLSVLLFGFSFVMAVVSFLPVFINTEIRTASGDMFWVMPVLVFGLGLIEVFYSRHMAVKGVIA
jgi:uncharacterized protein YceK